MPAAHHLASIQFSATGLLGGLDLADKSLRLLGLGVGKLVSEAQDVQQLVLGG